MKQKNPEVFMEIVKHASRAPTAHNTQPARWHLSGEDLCIYSDEHARLPSADPSMWSYKLSIGTSIEGLSIAASKFGYQLQNIVYSEEDIPGNLYHGQFKKVGFAQLEKTNCSLDPLYEYVLKRKSFRGKFHLDPSIKLNSDLENIENMLIITDRGIIERTAELHLEATYEDMKRIEYNRELYNWINFIPKAKGYKDSGFTAKTLYLSPIEQIFGPIILNPYIFQALRLLGLGKLIVSQTETDKSATYLALVMADEGTNPYECGRIFYRKWLELTKAGLHACPISTVVDCSSSYNEFIKMIEIPKGKMIVDLLKVGFVKDETQIVSSNRLEPEALILK